MAQMPNNQSQANNNSQKRKIASLAPSAGLTVSQSSETPQFAQIRLSDDIQMANGTTVISADGVAYRLVQFPTDSFQSHPIVTTNQSNQTHIINAEDLQQLMSNTTFVTSTPQLQLHSANDQQSSQNQNQFYMVMGSSELLQSPSQSASLQPAAFIPITKLELPQQTSSVGSSGQQHLQQSGQAKANWPSRVTPGSPLVVKEVKRRSSHNEVEKRRRDKINNWIMKLAKLVPLAEEETAKNTCSKGAILSKTVDYLVELQSAQKTSESERLQNEVLFLKAENIYLRKLLSDANISAVSSDDLQLEFDQQQQGSLMSVKRAKLERKRSSLDGTDDSD